MAKNQAYPQALHITLTADKDYLSGDPVLIGQIAGVAQIDAKKNERVTVWLDGSWNVPVKGAVKEGDPVYLATTGLTATASGNKAWGIALTSQTSDGTIEAAPLGYITPAATA